MKKVILLVVAIGLLYSCKKSVIVEPLIKAPEEQTLELPEEPPKVPLFDPEKPFLGRWKLMTVTVPVSINLQIPPPSYPPFDYSKSEVFFEFMADSTLIVSGDMDLPVIDWYVEQGLSEYLNKVYWPGTYTYIAKHHEGDYFGYWWIDLKRHYDLSVFGAELIVGQPSPNTAVILIVNKLCHTLEMVIEE